jgi:hypothetical protein
LLAVDRRLAVKFEIAVNDSAGILAPKAAPESGPTTKSMRHRHRHQADTIFGIKERLENVDHWTRGPKAAMALLHERARNECAQARGAADAPGPYRALEVQLFGDPARWMHIHEEQGLGFGASLIDGPQVDLASIAGLQLSDNASDRLVDQCSWQAILDGCSAAHCIEIGEQDGPGVSDVFYWVSVTHPEELARQIREFIVRQL